jgi:hypothetical protein
MEGSKVIKIVRREEKMGESIVEYDITLEKSGKEFELMSTDPYGFFVFKAKRGKVHSLLDGSFTSFDAAKKALVSYDAQTELDKEVILPKVSTVPTK